MGDRNHLGQMLTAAQTLGFSPFSPLHVVVLGVFGLFLWALVAAGREARRNGAGRELERWLGGGALAIWILLTVYWLAPERLSIQISLPLHLCDLANLIAALALLCRARFWRVLLHYWAFGLSTQAFITPTVSGGPESLYFWTFWSSHFAIVGAAVYDVLVRGFATDWRDFRTAFGATFAWVAFVFILNIFLGTNYGYVGEKQPATPTLITALGPWPWRAFAIMAIATAGFALLTLVSLAAQAAVRHRPSPEPSQTRGS